MIGLLTGLGVGDWLAIVAVPGTLVQLFPRGMLWLRKRRLQKFWRPNKRGWCLVLPVYGDATPPSFARIEDVQSAQLIRQHLKEAGIEVIERKASEPIPEDYDVILICGPVGNSSSKQFAESTSLTLTIVAEPNGGRWIEDRTTQTRYESPHDRDAKVQIDHALIGRTQKHKGGRTFVYLWGLHGVGTLGAARMLFDQEFVKDCLDRAGLGDFSAVVRVAYDDITTITSTSVQSAIKVGRECYAP